MVDIKKEDGFTALHLAAFNDHTEICETLLTMASNKPVNQMNYLWCITILNYISAS